MAAAAPTTVSKVDTVDNALGNNETSASSKGKQQYRGWCFTMHTEKKPTPDEDRKLASHLAKHTVKGAFQLELCPETGSPHYQGYLLFKNAKQLGGVVKLLKIPGAKHPHCSNAKAKDDEASHEYCNKEDTRAPGHEPFAWGWPAK